jgi:hypothetical protein
LTLTCEIASEQRTSAAGPALAFLPEKEPPDNPTLTELENRTGDTPVLEAEPPVAPLTLTRAHKLTRLQRIIEDGTPECLEAEVRNKQSLLEKFKHHLARANEHTDAQHFLQQIGKCLSPLRPFMIPFNEQLSRNIAEREGRCPYHYWSCWKYRSRQEQRDQRNARRRASSAYKLV